MILKRATDNTLISCINKTCTRKIEPGVGSMSDVSSTQLLITYIVRNKAITLEEVEQNPWRNMTEIQSEIGAIATRA